MVARFRNDRDGRPLRSKVVGVIPSEGEDPLVLGIGRGGRTGSLGDGTTAGRMYCNVSAREAQNGPHVIVLDENSPAGTRLVAPWYLMDETTVHAWGGVRRTIKSNEALQYASPENASDGTTQDQPEVAIPADPWPNNDETRQF